MSEVGAQSEHASFLYALYGGIAKMQNSVALSQLVNATTASYVAEANSDVVRAANDDLKQKADDVANAAKEEDEYKLAEAQARYEQAMHEWNTAETQMAQTGELSAKMVQADSDHTQSLINLGTAAAGISTFIGNLVSQGIR